MPPHSRLLENKVLTVVWMVVLIAVMIVGVKRVNSVSHPASSRSNLMEGPQRSVKRGIGTQYHPFVNQCLVSSGASWFYSWTPFTSHVNITHPSGIEFVPQIWGVADATPDTMDAVAASPGEYLLGFNEPDRNDQARMSPAQALDLWPLLEGTKKTLGSPATGVKPLQSAWMKKFMEEAEKRNLRIDFIAVHYYFEAPGSWNDIDAAVETLKNYMIEVKATYGRPIWLTEFAMTRWFPKPSQYPPMDVQAAFAYAAADMMEQLDFVHRYAFFSLFNYTSESTAHLCDNDGVQTIVGRSYAAA